MQTTLKIRKNNIYLYSLIIGLLLYYTQLGTPIYYTYFIIIGTGIYIFSGINKNHIPGFIGILAMIALSMLSVSLRDGGAMAIHEQIRSSALLLASLAASLGFAGLVVHIPNERLANLFYKAAIILCVGALLDITTPLKDISDQVREFLYPNAYKSSLRDEMGYLFIRPNFFAQEPSYLGKYIAISITLSRIAGKKALPLIILTILGTIIVRSPTIAIAGIIIWVTSYNDEKFLSKKWQKYQRALFLTLAIAMLFALAWVAYWRLGLFGGSMDISTYLRVIRPAKLAFEAIQQHPLTGFGFGADSQLADVTKESVSSTGLSGSSFFKERLKSGQNFVQGNSHLSFLTQVGLLGSALWVFSLFSIIRFPQLNRSWFLAFYLAFGMFTGSVNTVHFLFPLVLFAAILRNNQRAERATKVRQGRAYLPTRKIAAPMPRA